MKKVEFERKDGTKGHKYVLEAGDEITSKYDQPRTTKQGKYENHSIAIEPHEQNDIGYVQLTKGQAEKLTKLGNIQGKTILAYKYTNDFGDQVGVMLK